ncbi:MAG: c-type cytochrome [Chloroflexi bacterium]|nr:c-type cytochrome [Chloroflexota bacterium]
MQLQARPIRSQRELLPILWLFIALVLSQLVLPSSGQDEPSAGCTAEELSRQQQTVAEFLPLDFANDRAQAIANLYRLGALYQSMALYCNYQPNAIEINAMLERALEYASLDELIAAQSVGRDIAEIIMELDEVYGDPLAGQQLYNGEQPALGGVMLGCSGCHTNEESAPLTAGAWTRANEIRLQLPQFADYDERRYLVESIVQPRAYVVPEFLDVMPEFYAGQLTLQQLADLVAYLESQDQLLDDA